VLVYLPQGGEVTLNLHSLRSTLIRVGWFDPRTGEARSAGTPPRRARMTFAAPWTGPCSDWVLVLDEADQPFGAPGSPMRSTGCPNQIQQNSTGEPL
jgi:hypothetical protein